MLKFIKFCIRTASLPYYLLRKIFPGEFFFKTQRLLYLYHLHGFTYVNERTIEIPIVTAFIKGYLKKNPQADVLEVGDTLSHYFSFTHDIVDKYPDRPSSEVIGADIMEYAPTKKYNLIFSISSLEHVGWDEFIYGGGNKDKMNPKVFGQLIVRLKSMLKPGGTLLITVPMGYSDFVDSYLMESQNSFKKLYFFKRTSFFNTWKETAYNEVKNSSFNRTLIHANAIAIGIIKQS